MIVPERDARLEEGGNDAEGGDDRVEALLCFTSVRRAAVIAAAAYRSPLASSPSRRTAPGTE